MKTFRIQIVLLENAFQLMLILVLSLFIFSSCSENKAKNSGNVEIAIDDSCDNPDADINCYFAGMPESLTHVINIAGKDEPGMPLFIQGKVLRDNKPVEGAVIYAYHTDNNGLYSKNGNESGVRKWHGRLHGWCRTNASGLYEIHTIKPAPYPGDKIPAHIHMAVKLPGNMNPFFIPDIVFSDDTFLQGYKEPFLQGGTGIVQLQNMNGILTGERNINITF